MSVDKTTPSKKAIAENKVVEDSTSKAENRPDSPSITESKRDTAASKQGMGEGQKAVSKAYKDNRNDIFGKKKKR
jgi:hypothetical protein